MKTLFVWLLLSNLAFAAETCVTVDDAAWPQRQKNLLTAVAYELSYEADPAANRLPRVTGNLVCVDDPTYDVPAVLSQLRLETRYQEDEQKREAAKVAIEQRQAQLDTEHSTNPFCTETFEQVSARLDAVSNAMPELREAVKQLARCFATLREQQGR